MTRKEQKIVSGGQTGVGHGALTPQGMMKKEWTVLIKGLGVKKVYASADIDDAYMVASEQFGCAVKDILAIMPVNNEQTARQGTLSIGSQGEPGLT